jgi:hypothetical protein
LKVWGKFGEKTDQAHEAFPALEFGWPEDKQTLKLKHQGKGKPWVFSEAKQAVVQKVVAPPPPPPKPATETGIRLKTVLAEGGEPIKKDLDYQILSVEQDLEGNRQRVAFSYDAQPLIKLNAGKYRLRVGRNSTA